jgi:hypothetical protein
MTIGVASDATEHGSGVRPGDLLDNWGAVAGDGFAVSRPSG